ncbi:metallophosphoesterase family protein [Ramlibacter albus]|uniref:Metallophosphoesterase family protein n=1 Tax=Ramlibacter albus TaxID=2079448 RepID=A0A923M5L6_9BURK|nr:metallophosphoesterase family protein [Ramlibacter albus]MBC5763254.1 metallophosphoesterase family protein [Ramlibacter albus]
MKLALLSDLHANLRAVQACVAHARDAGATQFAVLGDIVGYGAEPGAVVDEVMQLAAQGAIVLRGNHDDAAVTPPAHAKNLEGASAKWTHRELTAAQRGYLSSLPLTQRIGGSLLVHASAHEPARWNYVDNPHSAARCLEAAAQFEDVTEVFCGHVHEQRMFYRGRGRDPMPFVPVTAAPACVPATRSWVATVGSVGQPRDGDPRAMYALFDTAQSRLVFHRVPYDHTAAAEAVLRAGLPDSFARRLQEGR